MKRAKGLVISDCGSRIALVLVCVAVAARAATARAEDELPVVKWCQIWGSSNYDFPRSVLCDSEDNVYTLGSVRGSVDGQQHAGKGDPCVTKHDTSGAHVWTRMWGSPESDGIAGACIDSRDCIIAAGGTRGEFGGQTNTGISDAFLTKVDRNGNLLWTRIWGGHDRDGASDVVCDNEDNIYVAGETVRGFDGHKIITLNPDVFLTKFSSDGRKLWTRFWGSFESDYAFAIAFDGRNGIYVSGETYGKIDGQVNPKASRFDNVFLTKLDTDGNRLWTRIIVGSMGGECSNIACDSLGNAYVATSTCGSPDGFLLTKDIDFMLVKFDGDGNTLWTRVWGSSAHDGRPDIVLNGLGEIYVGAGTHGDIDDQHNSGSSDCCITRYTSSGERLWTLIWGSEGCEWVKALACDRTDHIYALGYFGFEDKKGYDFHLSKLAQSRAVLAFNAADGSTKTLDCSRPPSESNDQDGDGASDQDELLAGTNPLDPKSVFVLTGVANLDNESIILKWSSASNRVYNILQSTNLLSEFSVMVSNIPATPPENVYTDSVRNVRVKYYCVEVVP